MPRPVAVALAFGLGVTGAAVADATRHSVAATVTVTFTDTRLVVSRGSLETGTVTFVVINRGRKLHMLAIEGPGLNGARTQKVAAGRSARLTLTLLTGAYSLSDPAGLGPSVVRWLVVSPATRVSGSQRVIVPITSTTGMNCD